MPTVVIGQERPFASCDLVTSDNLAGTAEVTDHLVAAGHRAAIYLAGPAGTSARTRRLTLLETARGTPLSVRVVLGGATVDAGFASTLALIERGELIRADAADAAGATVAADAARDGHPRRATALLCYNDQCAQGALVALARRGLSVPDDISVTGFDNTRGAASRAFDLTSVDREPAAVATLAVDMAISRCEGRDGPPRSESVRTRMVARSSSGPAPGAP
jgi:transcriptional regulator, lacI family